MDELVLTPAEFVALLNQTFEIAYPIVAIEGELSSFRVARGRWVYFSLKDDEASVPFFGTVYQLPGPLEDGLMVRATGSPRLHPRFGFTVNLQTLVPVGEGALKKAADLVRQKLEAEGLFAPERKRSLPAVPQKVGLITAQASAAYADFIKILGERWRGLEISLADVYVQGEQAPASIIAALNHFNQLKDTPEVLVITRGGGSAEDLAAFNDERVVRAVAASRIPTLIAVGHEIDVSLAELAADARASTPSNAAQVLVPDRAHELEVLGSRHQHLARLWRAQVQTSRDGLSIARQSINSELANFLKSEIQRLEHTRKLVLIFDPLAALKRGYALVSKAGKHVLSIKQVSIGDQLGVQLYDGTVSVNTTKVIKA